MNAFYNTQYKANVKGNFFPQANMNDIKLNSDQIKGRKQTNNGTANGARFRSLQAPSGPNKPIIN